MKRRTGKGTEEVLAAVASSDQEEFPVKESGKKVMFYLHRRQCAFLDGAGATLYKTTGLKLQRSGIIRALLDTLQDSGFDIAKTPSEMMLRVLLQEKWLGQKGLPDQDAE